MLTRLLLTHTPRHRLYSALVPKNCLILDLATSAEKKGTKSVTNAVSDVCFDEKLLYNCKTKWGIRQYIDFFTIASTRSEVHQKLFLFFHDILVWDSRVWAYFGHQTFTLEQKPLQSRICFFIQLHNFKIYLVFVKLFYSKNLHTHYSKLKSKKVWPHYDIIGWS